MSAQAQLFSSDLTFETPATEGIKYAGSKLKLIPQILRLARRVDAKTIFDGFSGTTRVSQAFAWSGYCVVSNDRSVWSEVFGNCYLKGESPHHYSELVRHLNEVHPRDGWFTEFYGGDPNRGDQAKRPWQIHNTRKLDGIREEIEHLALDPIEKCVALTSLILALDEVDSTLGHFASYLREWSPRSYKRLRLRVPSIVGNGGFQAHEVRRADIFDVVDEIETDIAYFDPPYGSNNEKMPPSRVRYAAYYHLWTTICLFDRPSLFGKVNRRADTSDTVAGSEFEEFRRGPNGTFIAVDAIARLLSGGRATSAELHQVIASCGDLIEVVEVDYKRNVMADMKWTNEWLRDAEQSNREFLFLVARR